MKKIIISSVIAVSLALGGCEKELDIENPNQATVEVFWKTADDAVKGVNAVYSTLHRGAISRWMPFYYIIRADEGTSRSPNVNLINNMQDFRITDYNFGEAYGIWNDNYVGIFRANQVLDNVPNITMDETQKQRVLGEAKFMRSLFYFHLVTLWGNVPLMLTTSTPADKPPTSPQADVWAQIEKDLTEAAAVLPLTYTGADLGRATKGAAQALLAKAYLQQRKFTQALVPLQALAEGEGKSVYSLMPNYRDNFLITSENNRESVFEWQFALNLTENHDDDIDPRVDNLNYGSSLPKFIAPPGGPGFSDGEANRWVVREFLQEETTNNQRDPRLAASFLYDSTDVRGPEFTVIYDQTFRERYGVDNQRVWFRKFLNDHWRTVDEAFNSPNNWRYIRYADVLLMYAEALNETGSTAQAYTYVDQVRQRAGLAKLSDAKPGLTKEQFLAQLKHERITELSGEGHRWNDLARWGDLGPALAPRDPGFANFEKGKHEFLPIPQQERDINPNLTQNPNW
ncbi:RagB/SusD family nutrient uptake outer membrane protein [Adhaeribacter pallidiroseus]|uniref:RagB/SusD family nutrient uptake outer membrane protein n=1 Tax=Adhaeribacter pallidiroseus TaxID=2072847 RepID=UPI000E1C116B|nr:RagB/SusD family nutrient uptake outer membrane protein [Adhaeribacter pallidiroseus]